MIPAIPHMISGSRSGALREDLQVLVALPVGDGRQVALPLVTLVVVEDLVEAPRERALGHLCPGEGIERGAVAVRHLLDVRALLQQLIGVALLRRAGGEPATKA